MIGNKKGNKSENFVCDFLKKKGYKIIKRNFHCKYGEVDIITEKDEYIVFVEVKARQFNSIINGRSAVDFKKKKRILKTAAIYLMNCSDCDLQPRFDVVEVQLSDENICGIEHIEDAFNAEGMFF